MLKSYEAIYDDGELKWLGDRPPSGRMKVIVTVLGEETWSSQARRLELLDRTRGCVDPPKTVDEIDLDISEMRAEWTREWDR